MKITNIDCYVLEQTEPSMPDYKWRDGISGGPSDGTPNGRDCFAYVRMMTDEGYTSGIKMGKGNAIADVVLRRLNSFVGANPLNTEKLWRDMWEIDRIERLQVHTTAIIDLLAWDIKSQKAQMPVYQMLGGHEPSIPAYASTVTWDTLSEYERHIDICKEEGFKDFKLHAWGDPKRDLKLCEQLRKWAGDDAVLMYDGSAAWDLTTSIKFGRELELLGYEWYEEPMREYDLYSYQKLCNALDIPVLASEIVEGSHWSAANWITAGALDMVRTSTHLKSGITGAIKIAQLADAHGMRAQVHGMGQGEVHIAAAIPNNDYYEQIVFNEKQIRQLRHMEHLAIVDSVITAPSEPRLLPEIDWSWVEKHAIYKV